MAWAPLPAITAPADCAGRSAGERAAIERELNYLPVALPDELATRSVPLDSVVAPAVAIGHVQSQRAGATVGQPAVRHTLRHGRRPV